MWSPCAPGSPSGSTRAARRSARRWRGWSGTGWCRSPATGIWNSRTRAAALATRVMRKHRLAECLLVDVIGLEWEQVHAEACRWEHVMSEAVERRVLELLRHPTESPYGNPIPGLEELGEKDEADPFLDEGMVSAGRPRPGCRRQDGGRPPDRRADPDGRAADVHAAARGCAARLRGERDRRRPAGCWSAAAARPPSWRRTSPRTSSSPSADPGPAFAVSRTGLPGTDFRARASWQRIERTVDTCDRRLGQLPRSGGRVRFRGADPGLSVRNRSARPPCVPRCRERHMTWGLLAVSAEVSPGGEGSVRMCREHERAPAPCGAGACPPLC